MTSNERRQHGQDLEKAVGLVLEGKMSLRQAEATFGIPKSTIGDYTSGRREIGSTKGPPTVLTPYEENS